MGWDRDSAGPAGSLASWPGDGSIPNSMGMSLPKDSGGVVHVSLTKQPDRDRADTLTACLKRPGFGKPGFCGTD
jgi:hypothetical protein